MKKRYSGRLNGCGTLIKYALFSANFVFAVLGCVVLGIFIYIAADKVYFVSAIIGSPLVTIATYMVLAAGCVMLCVSALGCCGAWHENRRILLTYAIFLSIAFCLAVWGAAMAIVFKSWVSDQIRTHMRSTLQYNYGMSGSYNEWITNSWDIAQQKWYCCAVEDQSWGIYRSSDWYKNQSGIPEATKPLVPPTCCKKDQYGRYIQLTKCQTYMLGPPGKQSGPKNEAVFYDGCFVAGTEKLNQVAGYIIGFGIIIALLMMSGIVFSVWLYLAV